MSNEEDIKSHLLENMKAFHEFCEDNSLRYFLLGGTLLGAVRHKGFIPWDDDLDVGMLRGDYEKLLSLKYEVPSGFSLNFYPSSKDYIYPFAKFCSNSLVVEEDFYIPFRTGVWIDVFPLDYSFDNILSKKVCFTFLRMARIILIIKKGAFKVRNINKYLKFVLVLLHWLFKLVPDKFIFGVMRFFEVKLPGLLSSKKNRVNYHGAWGLKEVAPSALFEKSKLYEFEGSKFWSIDDADFWLRKVYGDYMTFPPESARVSEHIGKICR